MRFGYYIHMRTCPAFLPGCLLALVLVLSFHAPASAGSLNSNPFETLQTRLIKDGFNKQRIHTLYQRPQVSFEINGVARFFAHREATLNYDQFASRRSIKKAKKYMKKHWQIFANTEKQYGVGKEVITSIILVESRLGTLVGGSPTLSTLSSLASLADKSVRNMLWDQISSTLQLTKKKYEKWAHIKSAWAYTELKAFLTYTAKHRIDPATILGSYAGAIGIAQFMPSNILALATDGNNDGQIDLFNHADAITSIASYLKHYGWHAKIDKTKAQKVIYRYNHSKYYVDTILKISELLKG